MAVQGVSKLEAQMLSSKENESKHDYWLFGRQVEHLVGCIDYHNIN
jgi:hypothetical protein